MCVCVSVGAWTTSVARHLRLPAAVATTAVPLDSAAPPVRSSVIGTPPGGGGGVDEAYMSSSQRPDSPTDSALPPSDRCSPVNHKGGGSSGSP
ncbi:hypothetical protein MTO96_033926 [Rhipicephalus appendiculatus]